MSFDVMEEGTPCDYCGQPVGFMDDDEVVCPTCRAEYSNMDYTGDEINEDEIGEWNVFYRYFAARVVVLTHDWYN